MSQFQNYTTVDSYRLSQELLAKVSFLTSKLKSSDDPKGELVETEEYVVSLFHVKGWNRRYASSESCSLIACEHFKGEAAEEEAMKYYLGLIEPDEFPAPELNAKNYKTWLKEKSFKVEKFFSKA